MSDQAVIVEIFDAAPGALDGWRPRFNEDLPDCSEDTMPGELSNVMAGRVPHHGCVTTGTPSTQSDRPTTLTSSCWCTPYTDGE